MRTINISTVIGGVADALPTKLSRKLLGGCACLGILLLSSPLSAAAGFDTPGWSVSGGGVILAPVSYPTNSGFQMSWAEGQYSSGSSARMNLYITPGANYIGIRGGMRFNDSGNSYDTLLANQVGLAYPPGTLTSDIITQHVGRVIAAANLNGPSQGFTGTWSYIPPASGLGGQLVYTPRLVTPVAIDIKPGSPENTVNLGSQGVTKVAVLGSEDFDATQVDPLTVELADATVRVKGNGQAQTTLQDTNGDSFLDLVLHMETEGFSLTEGDVSATLTGTTFGGEDIEGEDLVRVVP